MKIEGREGREEEGAFGFEDELERATPCCLSLDEGLWRGVRDVRLDSRRGVIMLLCLQRLLASVKKDLTLTALGDLFQQWLVGKTETGRERKEDIGVRVKWSKLFVNLLV